MALELGEIEIRPRAALDESLRIIIEMNAEVEQARRYGGGVDEDIRFEHVPPAWANDQRRDRIVEAISLAVRRVEGQRAARRVNQVRVSGDDVVPGRRERVFEIGHEDEGTGVERVDH